MTARHHATTTVAPEPVEIREDPRRRMMWRALGWASVVMTTVVVAASLTAYAAYRKLYANIGHEDVAGQLGARPPKIGKALNILVIGSDTRGGANRIYGRGMTQDGSRSDTIMLLHLPPDLDHAIGVSFPRDSMVQIPACRNKMTGVLVPQHLDMINSAFNVGGAACTWKTVESLTGLHVDHFVQVDFSGFKRMVDALGGVEICLPKAVDDRDSKLRLTAGEHLVNGEQALGYVRMRYGLGDGSDLNRIKRQQLFLAAVFRKASDTGLLTNPGRLYGFLNAATQSVTTDSGLDVDQLRNLALSGRRLTAGKLRFVTVPVQPWPQDPNRVTWAQPAAGQLFDAIKNDTMPQSTPSRRPTTPPASPSQVEVRVLNGTGMPGLAAQVAEQLKARGFTVAGTGNATSVYSHTLIRYAPGAERQADAVAALVPGVQRDPFESLHTGTVVVVVGKDWPGLRTTTSSQIPAGVSGVTGDTNPCSS